METLEYIEQERRWLDAKDAIIKLQRENEALKFSSEAYHEKVMQLHERIAQMEMEHDDLVGSLRQHIVVILFGTDDEREYWRNQCQEHFPNEVRHFEQSRGTERGSSSDAWNW